MGDVYKLSPDEKQAKIDRVKEDESYEVLDEIPFWSNGAGFTNKKRSRLYLYESKKDQVKELTDEFTNVLSLSLSKDKKRALFICSSFIDKMSVFNDLFQLNIESLTLEKVSPIKNFEYTYADYIGDKIIFLGTDMRPMG